MKRRWLAKGIACAATLAISFAPALAQVGQQFVITVRFAGPLKPAGGAYYIAFTVDDTILLGPQSDGSDWTHYVVYRGGRFFFGRVPPGTFRPAEVEAVRPPVPFLFGQVLSAGSSLRVQVALADLATGSAPLSRVKLNVVTVDEFSKPIDALGRGATDRFGFVTIDTRRDTFVMFTDLAGDTADPAFDITGGEVQLSTP